MTADLKRRIRRRAKGRCEYCQIPARFEQFKLQIDHVIAIKHQGTTHLRNLALACAHCNGHKGTDIASIDPKTNTLVALFNPRKDRWHDHFRWQGALLIGKTDVARATVQVLAMNAGRRVAVRAQLMTEGVY